MKKGKKKEKEERKKQYGFEQGKSTITAGLAIQSMLERIFFIKDSTQLITKST